MGKLINKVKGYTIIGQNISKNRRLGMKERGLFLTILSLPDNWEFSVIGLSKILPDGKAAIQSTVHKLEKEGYLKRVQVKGEKGEFAGYDWQIISQPKEESPLTENRSTDNRSTENRLTDNQSQLNTKISNTKKSISVDNQSINLKESTKETFEKKVPERLIDETLIEEIKDQIEYKDLTQNISEEDLEIAINAIAIFKTATRPMKFNNRLYPPEMIRKRADEIEKRHIEYAFECFYKNKNPIGNIKAYLHTTLFNAPDTYSMYYYNQLKSNGEV